MSRTTLWALVAAVAAVILIGGTVWLLRIRDIGGLPAFLPLSQNGQTTQEQTTKYDPPSDYSIKGKKPVSQPLIPKSMGVTTSVDDLVFPSTMKP